MHPHDPHGRQWPHQGHPQYQQWQQGYPPPQYYQQQQPRRVKAVQKKRGLGVEANTVHLLLTLFTCGLWLCVWIPWWIIRMVIRRKEVTRYYQR